MDRRKLNLVGLALKSMIDATAILILLASLSRF